MLKKYIENTLKQYLLHIYDQIESASSIFINEIKILSYPENPHFRRLCRLCTAVLWETS